MTWKVKRHANGTYLVYDEEDWYVMSCQDEQRAHLIAQAPRMLEALEAIVAVKHPQWCDFGAMTRAYNQRGEIARAAIAAVKEG